MYCASRDCQQTFWLVRYVSRDCQQTAWLVRCNSRDCQQTAWLVRYISRDCQQTTWLVRYINKQFNWFALCIVEANMFVSLTKFSTMNPSQCCCYRWAVLYTSMTLSKWLSPQISSGLRWWNNGYSMDGVGGGKWWHTTVVVVWSYLFSLYATSGYTCHRIRNMTSCLNNYYVHGGNVL